MLKNYFKIAFRNLWRNQALSAINILGLTLGIATTLIMMLFVQNELSYDRYNASADQMVRVVFRGSVDGQKMKEANVMPPVAKTLLANYPEVKQATRLMKAGTQIISYGDKSFEEDQMAFVDANFFKVFTLPLLEGNAATALAQPNSIIITTEVAHKYFGADNGMGKILMIKGAPTGFKVTGIIDKVPDNSHFHFQFFVSMENVPDASSGSFMTSGYYTYLVLNDAQGYKELQAQMPAFVDKYIGPQLQKGMGLSIGQFRKKGNDIGLYLQPLTDIHLHSDFTNDLEPEGDVRYVYIFSSIAFFMLLIACINFMNLSTAGASKRAREVGIRKVLGSRKMELVRQFLMESVLLSVIAVLLALIVVQLVLPLFNSFSGKVLSLSVTSNPWIVPFLFLLATITGILAGSYPAFFLSSFKPVNVLKGKFTFLKKTIGLRSSLVVFQFFISIVLISATVVVYRQLSYMQQVKLGYEKNQVVVLSKTYLLGSNQAVFYNQLLHDSRVQDVSISDYLPAGVTSGNNFFIYPGDHSSDMVKTLRYDVDYEYLSALGIQMDYGRFFSRQFGTDSSGIVLNETAATALGWSKDALGKTLSTRDDAGKQTSYHVIGVVKDFHFKSLHELISPLVMVLGSGGSTMIVKINTKDIAGLLATLKTDWAGLSAQGPINYSFLDDRVQHTYEAEQKTGVILAIFAGLTICIACLGLFGLVIFTVEQQRKQIGIRKVLGAGVPGLVGLLSKDFLKLVLIGMLIATPVAWWAMSRWLQDFAYRVKIAWWMFAVAGIAVAIIALLTISIKAIKAAVANPVNSLRTE